MGGEYSAQTKMIRLGRILRIFMEKEEVAGSWLSSHFGTTARTIQRDLALLKESGFPLREVKKGVHAMSRDLVRNLEVFDDTELALVVALKNMVEQMGSPFREAAEGVLERLCEFGGSMPVFVKMDDPVPLEGPLLNRAVRAIREKRLVTFQYTTDRDSHPVTLEPYRVASFGGFWYLIGRETDTGITKRYALDRITSLKLKKDTFRSIPANLDETMKQSSTIWFTETRDITVRVRIDAAVSHYFQRRTMFPTQEILKEEPDGSLVVIFQVGRFEGIRAMFTSWIPHIVVLEPEEFRKDLLKDVRTWVIRQGAADRRK